MRAPSAPRRSVGREVQRRTSPASGWHQERRRTWGCVPRYEAAPGGATPFGAPSRARRVAQRGHARPHQHVHRRVDRDGRRRPPAAVRGPLRVLARCSSVRSTGSTRAWPRSSASWPRWRPTAASDTSGSPVPATGSRPAPVSSWCWPAGAGSPSSGAIYLDRLGKGIRTAPRDALISLSSARDKLGASFGVHRAFDTLGAVVGPLLAAFLLARNPTGFEAVFVVSFFIAVIGLGRPVLLRRGPPRAGRVRPRPDPTVDHGRGGRPAEGPGVPTRLAAGGRVRPAHPGRRDAVPGPRAPGEPERRLLPAALLRHLGGVPGRRRPLRAPGRPDRPAARLRGRRDAAGRAHSWPSGHGARAWLRSWPCSPCWAATTPPPTECSWP